MQFAILGPLRVLDERGADRTPKPLKLRTLLAAMIVNAGKVVSAPQLTNELWPEGAPRTSATAIHVYVSQLRKHLDKCRDGSERVLITRQPGYLLRTADHDVDLSSFRHRVAAAKQAEAAGDMFAASGQLDHALALWSGDALADVRGGEMVHHFAQGLDEIRLAATERRVRIDLCLGRHHEVLGELRALVGRHPHWENFHGYLMIALYRAGRTTEALTVYSRLRQRLVDRLGMEPADEIQELQRFVLNRNRILNQGGSVRLLSATAVTGS